MKSIARVLVPVLAMTVLATAACVSDNDPAEGQGGQAGQGGSSGGGSGGTPGTNAGGASGGSGDCVLPGTQTTDQEYAKDSDCPQELQNVKGLCHTSKSKGFFCLKNKVAVRNCANNDCYLETGPGRCGFVGCQSGTGGGGGGPCTLPNPGTTTNKYRNGDDCPEELNGIKGLCHSEKGEGYYCASGKVKVKTCSQKDCVLKQDPCGFVGCQSELSCTIPDNYTTDKTYNAGDPCPSELDEAKGLCSADKKKGYYCKKGADGTSRVVGVKECPAGDCSLDNTPGKCRFIKCGN